MRSNKDPGLDSRSFVIDKERVQSLDTNTVNMTAVMCMTEKVCSEGLQTK